MEEFSIYLKQHEFEDIIKEFDDSDRLRFLHANEFKPKETVVSMM